MSIKRGNITAAPGALCAGALCALLRHNAAACALCAHQGHYGPAHNARQCVGQRSAHYAPAHYARAAPIRRLLAHYVFYLLPHNAAGHYVRGTQHYPHAHNAAAHYVLRAGTVRHGACTWRVREAHYAPAHYARQHTTPRTRIMRWRIIPKLRP